MNNFNLKSINICQYNKWMFIAAFSIVSLLSTAKVYPFQFIAETNDTPFVLGTKEMNNPMDTILHNHQVAEESKEQQNSSLKIYDHADILPQFPGGVKKLNKYISRHFNIKTDLLEESKEIRITLEYVVNQTGEITDIQVIKCSHKDLGIEEEAVKLFQNMPKWEPAKIQGEHVAIRSIQTIRIVIY